jgi:hypothetical protein
MKKIYLDWCDLQRFLDGEFRTDTNKLISENILLISMSHLYDLSRGATIDKKVERAKKLDKVVNKIFLVESDILQSYEVAKEIEKFTFTNLLDSSVIHKDRLYKILGKIKDTSDQTSLQENDSIERFVSELHGENDASVAIQNMWEQSQQSAEILYHRRQGRRFDSKVKG